MKWIEAKVIFEAAETPLAAERITGIFLDLQLKGVAIEDRDVNPAEDGSQPNGIPSSQDAVIGYFPKDRQLDGRCKALTARLDALAPEIGLVYHIACRELDEEDWAESWKTYFKPLRIGRRLVVKPTWREFAAEAADLVLEIDPGMAFGIGSHPTTGMCLELLEKCVRKNQKVLDLGTGSGILLIAAARLGAVEGLGIDSDATAVDIATQNLKTNGLNPPQFRIRLADLLSGVTGTHDLVVANILTPVIVDLLADLPRVMAAHGIFICSGMLSENERVVAAKLKASGFEIFDRLHQDDWVALAARFAAVKVD